MFVVYDKDLNINWEFKWEYRKEMGTSTPNTWATRAYVRFLDRNTRERGILGSAVFLDKDHVSKDEMRLNLLYQALDILCNVGNPAFDRKLAYESVLRKYDAVHSVPKPHTKLGPHQKRILLDI